MVRDPAARLNADDLLAHPWVTGVATPRKVLPNVTQQIKEFNNRRRFKVSLMIDFYFGDFINQINS